MESNPKIKLRTKMLQYRAARSAAEREAIDCGIYNYIKRDDDILASQVVMLYSSIKNEISTQFILNDLLKRGQTVCLPRCTTDGSMIACSIRTLDDLIPGKFHIPEPGPQCTPISSLRIDSVIVPCLCADRAGYRLGYGGGYYDRFLCRAPRAKTLALCASDCMVATVYPEQHDIRCTKIVTERGILLPHEK